MTVIRALVLSLAIHLLLVLGLRMIPEDWAWDRATPDVAEIQIIETPAADRAKTPQIVRDVDAPDLVKEEDSKDKARFLSAKQQRVLVESQARETGLTRNTKTPPLPHDSWLRKYAERNGNTGDDKPREKSLDGYEPIRLPSPKDSTFAFEGAPATTGELLPDDVSLGEFTALNTDRFKYYSFYARIEELVRFRWEQGLRNAIDSFPRNQLLNLNRDRWVTEAEFWLTKDGRFHSAHIHRESGLRRFDGAAVNAFRDANIFPNPPPEMVEKDGLIRIKYSFTVRWSPNALVGR